MQEPGDVTRLLLSWSGGDSSALEKLTPIVYQELRRMAGRLLRQERAGHTLQPTALVHEAYVRMVDQGAANFQNRAHFFAIAANLMRQILVNHAKRRRALKRGGANLTVLAGIEPQTPARSLDLIALDDALEHLEQLDPRQSRVVELRFFGGLTEVEIAGVLNVSPITVKRDWRVARAVLHQRLTRAPR